MRRVLLLVLSTCLCSCSFLEGNQKSREAVFNAKRCLKEPTGYDVRHISCKAVDVSLIEDPVLAERVKKQIIELTGEHWSREAQSIDQQKKVATKKLKDIKNAWDKGSVLDKCGGMSAVSPFIGSRGKILDIEVRQSPIKSATFRVQSGSKVVTSYCWVKGDGRTMVDTFSIE